MWIGILFICQTLCQILLSWLILPPDPSVPSSPLTAAAVNSAMALAQLSSCCLLAPCLIYLISKATLLQSLIGHHLCLPIILRWWMIQLSKTRSMSIMVTHIWSLPAVVTQWNKVAWWQIWTKHSSWLSIMQGVVMVYLEALLSQFLVGLVWEKISLWLLCWALVNLVVVMDKDWRFQMNVSLALDLMVWGPTYCWLTFCQLLSHR